MRVADKGHMIEYWVNNPGTSMRTLSAMYVISEYTAERIIAEYSGKNIDRPVIITRQSKMNMGGLVGIEDNL